MAKLPTVPQADITDALDKMNRPGVELSGKILSELNLQTGFLFGINNSLRDMLKLDEMRMQMEKLREGQMIEALLEARRQRETSDKKGGSGESKSLEDLLGIDLGSLGLLGLAAAIASVGALAVALKTEFEDIATALQGFATLKLGSKIKGIFDGLGERLLRPLRTLSTRAGDFAKSIKESKLARRFGTLIDDFKNMKFPSLKELGAKLVDQIIDAYRGLRVSILKMYGIGPDGKKLVVRGADGKFQKPFIRGIVESIDDMFRSMKTNLATYIDDALKAFKARAPAPITFMVESVIEFLTKTGSIIRGLFTATDTAADVSKEAGIVSKFFGGIGTVFKTIGPILGEILQPIKAVLGFLGGVVFDTIGSFFKTTGSVIGGLFDFLGPVLKPIKSVLGIIGKFSVILTPFFALYDFITGFWKGYTESEGSVVSGLEEGLKEVFRGFFTKPLDLLREYIVAPFVGLFSKDAEKAVEDFNITELFDNTYELVKNFIKNLIGDPIGTIKEFTKDFPNPIDFIGEKLFQIFVGVRDWIHSQSFLPDFLASPFEFLAESVGNLFDLDATGKVRQNVSGSQTVGAGGASGVAVATGTQKVAEGQSQAPIIVSAPSTQNTIKTSTVNQSQTLAVGASPHNSTPALGDIFSSASG